MKPPTLLALVLAVLITAAASAQTVPELLSEAQRAYVRNNLAEAREKFELVRRLEPNNQVANRYLGSINAMQAKAGGSEAAALKAMLQSTVMEKVNLKDATLAEALEFLRQKTNNQNPGRQPVNFIIQLDESMRAAKFSLSLSRVPVTEVLRYIGELTNTQFSYDKFAVVVKARAATPVAKPKNDGQAGMKIEGL